MKPPLYDAAILRLATEIPHTHRLDSPHGVAERRSPVCGSRVLVEVVLDDLGRIAELGQQVNACALGQASASLMGTHAIGRTGEDIRAAVLALGGYLAGHRGDPGKWPGLDIFGVAREYPSRHAAISLPFEALAEAARLAEASRNGLASAA